MTKRNPFGHIDLRVSSIDEALPFYEALMPELGFDLRYHGEKWKVWGNGADLPAAAYFGITESEGHVPNENRIAFWAQDAAEVDRIAALLEPAGACEISGPKAILMTNALRQLDAIVERGSITPAERAGMVTMARIVILSVL